MNENEIYAQLKALQAQEGRSKFLGALKRLMREKLENQERSPRKKRLPKAAIQRLYDNARGECVWCKLKGKADTRLDIPAVRNEVDHKDPNYEPFDGRENLQLLHGGCNREKGAMSLSEQAKYLDVTLAVLVSAFGITDREAAHESSDENDGFRSENDDPNT